MADLDAGTRFRAGLAALQAGSSDRALMYFSGALSDPQTKLNPQWRGRILSYYGLSLALANGANHDAVRACEQAIAMDDLDSELYYNLARVYLLASKRTRAMRTLERGMHIDPTSRRLARLRREVERRASPVLPRLGRDHPLNRSLGKLRARLLRKGA
ncbi:MAG: tetratricopeptide repeat protein [Planctomycetota bacterium]|jgi:tetratricopeptide (TPR) repeat protein